MVEREPESGLREVVHQRVRLGVLAVLDRQGQCTFSQLRDALGQSDGGLSRHLGVLEKHGYITTEKVFENRRPRTWVRLTTAGNDAFREEQELLVKLLARAEHDVGGTAAGPGSEIGGDEDGRTAAMTIVFAALLAGEDTDVGASGAGARADDDRSAADGTDHSALVPIAPVLVAGRRAQPIASGPISARYDFPADYSDFGSEQREQRLMLISHGLRGGWITTWRDDREQDADITAHVMVVELGGQPDCAAILATMGPPTVSLPRVPDARGYLLPGAGNDSPATAVAWLSRGPFLASVIIVAASEVAVPALENLVAKAHAALPNDRTPVADPFEE